VATGGPTRGYAIPGLVVADAGRSADIAIHTHGGQHLEGDLTITTRGRDRVTHAERQRGEAVLRVLQGDTQAFDNNPWFQKICFPSDDFSWPSSFTPHSTPPPPPPPDFSTLERPLNNSQLDAVKHMLSLSADSRITLIHGPPGTGKTTVIASFVHFAISQGQGGIWLTAQSNVAVKNIAEKLNDAGFTNWKLLVSRDFVCEWYVLIFVIYEPIIFTNNYNKHRHEHLYSKIFNNVIRSDSFTGSQLKKDLKGVKVILCTLSMLSNPQLIVYISRMIPITTLVIDEASQIEVGDYVAVFTSYVSSLRKVCFIGDDKQCESLHCFCNYHLIDHEFLVPPHGQEAIENLQSIFEVNHLRNLAIFLDIQCIFLFLFLF